MAKTDKRALRWLDKYLRYTDYLGAAQLYLKDNFVMNQEFKPEDMKERVLGHWGTVPGLNFIYAQLNYLICKHECEMLLITGPGHGAPAILANLFAEESLQHFYGEFPLNEKGMGKIIKDFSWPRSKFPSHVTPSVPGSILEGGELGYSLSTAYGAVLDHPDLIAAAIVGDGEAETGPIAAAWHSNKFFNPKNSGAVLPIVHINGFKISNPTIYGRMSNDELKALFDGYGYEPLIVDGANLEVKMMQALEKAYQRIRAIQKKARAKGAAPLLKPKWPVVLLRSPKGWKGLKAYKGHPVESSFRSHGVPVADPYKNAEDFKAVKSWLEAYKISKLVDAEGRPLPEVLEFLPKKKFRLGMSKYAIGGGLLKDLQMPNLRQYEVKVTKRGHKYESSMVVGAKMLRDIFKLNKKNFRLFCPDEAESNKLSAVFEATERAFMWPIGKNDEHMSPDGRVMEMLSEHTLQGWYQGYLLTGNHGMFFTYEAFAGIVATMVDQYAKFIKQSFNVRWRKPVGGMTFVLTSLGWRQEHNGYSHQNPSFVSNVLLKHGEFCQIYYPSDANSLLAAYEETLKKRDSISVIVAGKTMMPQWLTLKEAREQAKVGIGVWEWVGGKQATAKPDVVLASAGDYVTEEALFAVKLCKELIPEMKIRYVNVSEITSLALGDYCSDPNSCLTVNQVNKYFTSDKPVVFSYHGYVNDVEQVLWDYASSDRFTICGYREQGSTTTPFDMKVVNNVSRYQVAINLIKSASHTNKAVAAKREKALAKLGELLMQYEKYIVENGCDPDEINEPRWE